MLEKTKELFPKLFVIFFMLFGVLSADFDGTDLNENLNASQNPDHIVLTWTADPKTTQTITWRSSTAVNSGEVRYREAEGPSPVLLTEKAAVKKFSTVTGDKPGSFNIFSAALKDLKPDTRYVYKVFSGTAFGRESTFSTGVKEHDPFMFFVFGDSQSAGKTPDYSPWHETVTKAYAMHNEAKFMINMGDLTQQGMSYPHWNNWLEAAKGVIDRIPEMPVIGNHDGVGETTAANSAIPVYLMEQLPVLQNGPKELKGQAYSYDYGNAHIAVLNSEQVYGMEETARSQLNWLEEDLAATSKTWKLVFFHRAPYYNRPARTNEAVKKAFCPIFDKHHVDVVFNGHEHALARTYPVRQEKLYSNPKDGTVYYTAGRSGGDYYSDLSKKIWDAFFYDPQAQPCYETVQVKKNTLTINAYKQDGTLIDTYSIDKENSTNSTFTLVPDRFNLGHFTIFGNLPSQASSENLSTARKIDDKWFVNAKIFLGHIGGGAVLSSQNLELFYETRNLKVPPEKVLIIKLKEKKVVYVSVDIIKQFVGLDYIYDESLNLLVFTK